MPPIRFADNLRAARARLKLNQTALGRQIGIGQGAITKWETGKSSPPVDHLLILADALGATAADLLAGCVHTSNIQSSFLGMPQTGHRHRKLTVVVP